MQTTQTVIGSNITSKFALFWRNSMNSSVWDDNIQQAFAIVTRSVELLIGHVQLFSLLPSLHLFIYTALPSKNNIYSPNKRDNEQF